MFFTITKFNLIFWINHVIYGIHFLLFLPKILLFYYLKGAVNVFSWDLPFLEGHVQYTTELIKSICLSKSANGLFSNAVSLNKCDFLVLKTLEEIVRKYFFTLLIRSGTVVNRARWVTWNHKTVPRIDTSRVRRTIPTSLSI